MSLDRRELIVLSALSGLGLTFPLQDGVAIAGDLSRVGTLAGLLERRGHSSTRIEKILGGNFARLLRDVWG